MNLVIKTSDLMDKKSSFPMDELLVYCLSNKQCLHIEQIGFDIKISVDKNFPNPNKVIEIYGKWRSPYIDGRSKYMGSLLLSPFLFRFKKISIPFGKLTTLGRPSRSIADLVVRNIFFSICRGERVFFTRTDSMLDDSLAENFSEKLRKSYMWLIKSFLKDDFFNNKNFDSLIIASAHLDLGVFNKTLLRSGAKEFSDIAKLKSSDQEQSDNLKFNYLRSEILNLLG
jgi:hypothetical protein